jgi:hypothetical protein
MNNPISWGELSHTIRQRLVAAIIINIRHLTTMFFNKFALSNDAAIQKG